ncbi:MAG: hypothetical protein V7641_2932 [Blastocatellia bacterium]
MMNALAATYHSQLCILRNADKIVNTDARQSRYFLKLMRDA